MANTPELEGHIQELQQIHEVAKVDLEEITHSMELFNQSGKLEPMELANDETTRTKTNKTMALLRHMAHNHSSYNHP